MKHYASNSFQFRVDFAASGKVSARPTGATSDDAA
jgi:hypothetical protein